MRRILVISLSLLVALVVVAPAPAGAGTACDPGTGLLSGRVFDAATTAPLSEVTSVGIHGVSGKFDDGLGTDSHSRYGSCVPLGTYLVDFQADSYRHQWYNDAAHQSEADLVTVDADGASGVDGHLIPLGRVLAGRVTSNRGRPLFASIGISRRNAAGHWVSIDGIGNDPDNGYWEFQVPSLGRYRVAFFVDSYTAEWYQNASRLRFATTLNVTAATTFISGVNGTMAFCHPAPDFCIPPGFNS